MSLDNAVECSSCKQHAALQGWINVYPSIMQAKMSKGPEFLSAFIPGPMPVKVEMCLGCGHFSTIKEYSEQELEELKKYAEENKKTQEAGNNLGKLFGKFMGKQP